MSVPRHALLLLLLSHFRCVRLCATRDGSPPGSPIPGILQARILEWVAISFSKLADIEQEEKEAPGKFLDRLTEGLCRFTEIDPESEEGKVILKDRFLTQLAPDIRHKLLKWAYGPNQSLDNLLQLAQTVYYGREYEEKKERQKKKRQRKRRKPSQGL